MPRETRLQVTIDDQQRIYHVWYSDDPPARRAAIAFFREAGDLFPSMNIPPEVESMAIDDANEHLRRHPIQEQWAGLTLVGDVDEGALSRLEHVNELRRVVLMSDGVSDEGVKSLLWLEQLESLVLYSDRITNACLATIRRMSSLRTVDFQGSSRVTRAAFEATVGSLPRIEDSWSPEPP
jgi:hypothetical protein